MSRANNARIPDASTWKPEATQAQTLETAFFIHCQQIEVMTVLRKDHERRLSQYNFDSGPGVEDIVRDGVRQVLPTRYFVGAGTVSDSRGFTAGDCDIVVFNETWFPALKTGATPGSRRRIFPIEGIYAILEVKQSLDSGSLDRAMEKLVTCHRLYRPVSPRDRVVENATLGDCAHFISNPLYSAIIATGLQSGEDFQELVERFVAINRTVPRTDVIRALCVLGEGTVLWGYDRTASSLVAPQEAPLAPATFMNEDRYAELRPVLSGLGEGGCAFYELMHNLTSHLFKSVLAPDDVMVNYGSKLHNVRVGQSENAVLAPDPSTMALLELPCEHRHNAGNVHT